MLFLRQPERFFDQIDPLQMRRLMDPFKLMGIIDNCDISRSMRERAFATAADDATTVKALNEHQIKRQTGMAFHEPQRLGVILGVQNNSRCRRHTPDVESARVSVRCNGCDIVQWRCLFKPEIEGSPAVFG